MDCKGECREGEKARKGAHGLGVRHGVAAVAIGGEEMKINKKILGLGFRLGDVYIGEILG